jgi:excinuclease UvrABC nuclease subunit
LTQAIAYQDAIIRSGFLVVNGDGPETYLYRIYDVLENLIYVGISKDLAGRLANHSRITTWWHAAYRVEYDVYPTRAMASRAEVQSITQLKPSHNIANNHW